MKKMIFLILILGWVGVSAQKSLVYGVLDLTGSTKITKGAKWSERPWAKIIFEGGPIPAGCTVDTLKEKHFMMFVPGEHNANDGNYIVVSPGDVIINKDNKRYFGECANEILSLRPVVDYLKMFEGESGGKVVLRDTVYVEKQVSPSIVNYNITIGSFNTNTVPTSPDKKSAVSVKNGELKWWHIVLPLGAMIVGGVVYLDYRQGKKMIPIVPPVIPDPGQGKDPDLETPTPDTGQGQDGGLG